MGRQLGWISEKIFDCFKAKCVPVYLGTENIAEYIPEGSFIDRRKFKNHEELYQFLVNMDKQHYVKYQENIEEYLKSDKHLLFTVENFIADFLSVLFPGYNKKAIFTDKQLDILERIAKLKRD